MGRIANSIYAVANSSSVLVTLRRNALLRFVDFRVSYTLLFNCSIGNTSNNLFLTDYIEKDNRQQCQ